MHTEVNPATLLHEGHHDRMNSILMSFVFLFPQKGQESFSIMHFVFVVL